MAHEKVHVICENLCLEEGMTKEQIEERIIDVLDRISGDGHDAVSDFDEAMESGIYNFYNTAQNSPFEGWGNLIVARNQDYIQQIAIQNYNNGDLARFAIRTGVITQQRWTDWAYFKDMKDTGWVDLTPYISEGFAARTEFPPKARKIGNVVYLTGYVYCTETKYSNVATILRLPDQFKAPQLGEFGGSGVRWITDESYSMYVNTSGEIRVGQLDMIKQTPDFQGYSIGCVSGYLVD